MGHAGAGKSTLVSMLEPHGLILSDDRMIVREWDDGFKIHGNWSHGEIPIVSPESSALDALFFIEQSESNRIIPVEDRLTILSRILACLIKPYGTELWWDRVLAAVENLVSAVPFYRLCFDKSGKIVETLKVFFDSGGER